jgi:Tfp pilus assembly protein PilO
MKAGREINKEGRTVKTSQVRFWVGLVCLVGVFATLFYLLIHREQTFRIADLERQLSRHEEVLQSLQEVSANVSLFHKRVEFIREELTEERRRWMPTEPRVSELVNDLRLSGEAHQIAEIELLPEEPRGVWCYKRIPVKFKLKGGFKKISDFLWEATTKVRYLRVQNLVLSRPGPNPLDGEITAVGTFMAFSFKGPKCEGYSVYEDHPYYVH